MINPDSAILELSIKALSEAFDSFVGSCLSADGKPQPPDYRALMIARGSLPPYCKHALSRKLPAKEIVIASSDLSDYERGRRDMQNEIIDYLGTYEALKCAQIAASIPVKKIKEIVNEQVLEI